MFDKVVDDRKDISLTAAKKLKPDVKLDDVLMVESTPANAGRIAAQTAKQVILQRLHEAEHTAIFDEYAGKSNDIITGVVQRIEPKQVFVNLGRTEAILPSTEHTPGERYRLRARAAGVCRRGCPHARESRVTVSRLLHPNLLRRLFELEVPEVYNGIVEIKSISREAGYRSKVAVAARQEGIDPVGCCVGLRGIRIQNIVNELNGEKIDVVAWNKDVPVFIANSLSPAQVLSVEIGNDIATVVVPDKHLSLAIGKDGQNARLAAKLTGWRIDIKSASVAEAEKAAKAPPVEAVKAEVPAAAAVAAVEAEEAEAVTAAKPEEAVAEEVLVHQQAGLEKERATGEEEEPARRKLWQRASTGGLKKLKRLKREPEAETVLAAVHLSPHSQ